MKNTIYPTFTVHLQSIKENYHKICKKIYPTQVAAVVKDNAYGLGAKKVVQTLYPECKSFFVAYAKEGALIRPLAPEANIFILQGIGKNDLNIVKKNNLIPVLSSLEDISFWENTGIKNIKPALQMDTGLNRLGLRLSNLNKISLEQKKYSLFISHLGCSDIPNHPMNLIQLKTFEKGKRFFDKLPASLSASGGALLGKPYLYDMARVGALLYGISQPVGKLREFKNPLRIQAVVLQTAEIQAGESISYGATYTASRPRKIAIVSIGYADGLFVSLSNKGGFYFHNNPLPFLGRVCMDSTICDISDSPSLQQGDLVDVLNEVYTADDMAIDAQTNGYEILSRFGKGVRFIRSYKNT